MLTDNLLVKQVYVGVGTGRRRYVIAYNPQQAEADRITRKQNLDRLRCELEALNALKKKKSQCRLLLHPSMGRYVKGFKSGKLKMAFAYNCRPQASAPPGQRPKNQGIADSEPEQLSCGAWQEPFCGRSNRRETRTTLNQFYHAMSSA